MENTASQNKMGTAPVLPLIWSMSLPAMFSMLVQSLYNVVDSAFVAQLGKPALAAVSIAFPMQMMLVSVAVGTGVGVNSLISRRLGAGLKTQANSAANHGFVLATISWVVFAIIGILFSSSFVGLYASSAAVHQMGTQYLSIVLIFSFGALMQINVERTLQATGNMIYPMIIQLIGAVVNIVLDPIFIFGLFGVPRMEVAGAAIATVIGQFAGMGFGLYIIFTKSHDVHVSFKKFKLSWTTIKDIYIVGLPSIVMQSIGSVLIMGLNGIMARFSEGAVTVLGVYYKMQSFVFMPVFGLMHGVMPIIGYNYGARNRSRMMETLKNGCYIAFGIMVVGTAIFMGFPAQLLAIFKADAEMLEIGVPAFRIISVCFIPAAIGIMFSVFFQAIGMGVRSLIISVMRQVVIILPVAYFLSFYGLKYVWYSFGIAEIAALIVSTFFLINIYKNHIKSLPLHGEVAPISLEGAPNETA